MSAAIGKNVHDPVLGTDLETLKWLHPRVAISSDGTAQVLLKLPTLLHPLLQELKDRVALHAQRQMESWLSEPSNLGEAQNAKVNVEVLAGKPVPLTAHHYDDQGELLSSLGPGLAQVAQMVAVYSCKVRKRPMASVVSSSGS